MGTLINILLHSSEYEELKEVIITYWGKIEPFVKKNVQVIRISLLDSGRLNLLPRSIYKLLNLNIDEETKKLIVYYYVTPHYDGFPVQNKLSGVLNEIEKRISQQLHIRVDYFALERSFKYDETTILLCEKNSFSELVNMLTDFTQQYNKYKDLKEKMGQPWSNNIKYINNKYTELIQYIQESTILEDLPYLQDRYTKIN